MDYAKETKPVQVMHADPNTKTVFVWVGNIVSVWRDSQSVPKRYATESGRTLFVDSKLYLYDAQLLAESEALEEQQDTECEALERRHEEARQAIWDRSKRLTPQEIDTLLIERK